MAATDALKPVSGRPVALIHAPTLWTGPGRVARINADQRDAFQCGLVGQEGPELSEGPTGMCRSLAKANRYTFSNPRQLLNGDAESECLGFANETF